MIRPPFNNIVVKVKHKFTQSASAIAKSASIQQGATVHLEDFVNITGEVVSLPKAISDKREYKDFTTKDIRIGDTAIFSYSVICDFLEQGEGVEPKYKNSFFYDGQEYFNCDIRKLFAVIRDGEIRMQNGYVMVSMMDKLPTIILPAGFKKRLQCLSAEVLAIGEPFGNMKSLKCQQGDRVWFSPNVAQSYKINDKPFWIISQRHILGVEEAAVTG